MKNNYEIKYNDILKQIGNHAKIVLATSHNDRVSARKMQLYAETFNQIEGICKKIGHPLDYQDFYHDYKTYFLSAYENYSHLKNEKLFIIKPTFIQK